MVTPPPPQAACTTAFPLFSPVQGALAAKQHLTGLTHLWSSASSYRPFLYMVLHIRVHLTPMETLCLFLDSEGGKPGAEGAKTEYICTFPAYVGLNPCQPSDGCTAELVYLITAIINQIV